MAPLDSRAVSAQLRAQDYAVVERRLAEGPLEEWAEAWSRFSKLERLVLFKLLDAERALQFYGRLPFEQKYLLLCGFPLGSIASVLEALPLAQRRRFAQLPRAHYETMLRALRGEKPAAAAAGSGR